MVERKHESRERQAGVLMLLVMVSASAFASDDALRECGEIADAKARLACYDAIAATPAPSPVVAPTQAAPPTQAAAPTPGVPAETPKPASTAPVAAAPSKSGSDDDNWQARVVRCEGASDGRYFFHLDNGEVWKQVKADRKSYKDCDFSITVTRDWFGYKMSTEDSKRPMRISRVR